MYHTVILKAYKLELTEVVQVMGEKKWNIKCQYENVKQE
jgi:hypothetical protein